MLPLDALASTAAHLRHFAPGDDREVLARLGVSPRDYEAALDALAAERDAEMAAGRHERVAAFGVAFARVCRRLAAERPSLAALGPLPAPQPVAPEPEASTEPAIVVPVVQQSTAQKAPPPVVVPPAFAPPPARLAATLPLAAPSPAARLPFRENVAPERALESALAHGAPSVPRPAASAGGTVGVSTVGPLSAALPFAERPPAGCPDLTLPQYASLRVELQLHPDHAAAVLARYGVPEPARAALDDHWRRRFDADPLSRMEFVRAYAAYLGWVRQHAAR